MHFCGVVGSPNFGPYSHHWLFTENTVAPDASFDNASTYASQYRWEFSDGSICTEEHPVHVFNEAGIYDVTLYVEGYEGILN